MLNLDIKEIVTGFNTTGKGVSVLFNISAAAYVVKLENAQFAEIVHLLAVSYKDKKKLDVTVNMATQEILKASLAE